MRAVLGVMEELGGNGWVGETGPGTIFTHPQSLGLKLSRGTAFLPYRDNRSGQGGAGQAKESSQELTPQMVQTRKGLGQPLSPKWEENGKHPEEVRDNCPPPNPRTGTPGLLPWLLSITSPLQTPVRWGIMVSQTYPSASHTRQYM